MYFVYNGGCRLNQSEAIIHGLVGNTRFIAHKWILLSYTSPTSPPPPPSPPPPHHSSVSTCSLDLQLGRGIWSQQSRRPIVDNAWKEGGLAAFPFIFTYRIGLREYVVNIVLSFIWKSVYAHVCVCMCASVCLYIKVRYCWIKLMAFMVGGLLISLKDINCSLY